MQFLDHRIQWFSAERTLDYLNLQSETISSCVLVFATNKRSNHVTAAAFFLFVPMFFVDVAATTLAARRKKKQLSSHDSLHARH